MRHGACSRHLAHISERTKTRSRIASGGQPVRNTVAFTAAVCLFSVSAIAWTTAQPKKPAPSVAETPIDDVLNAVRSDLQSDRADILAKNMKTSSELAGKFWPMYETSHSRENAIMAEQLKRIRRLIDNLDTLNDAGAAGLITGHFNRDEGMNALGQNWFGEFHKGH